MYRIDSGRIVPALWFKATPNTIPISANPPRASIQFENVGRSAVDGRKNGSTHIIAIVIPIKSPSIEYAWTARPYSIAKKNNTIIVSGPYPRPMLNVLSCVCVILCIVV